MRIASSPNLRNAAGSLLAALLSIVGYQVFRQWISHGPEALQERADDLSWLVGAAHTKLPNLAGEQTPLLFLGLLHVPKALVPSAALLRFNTKRNAMRFWPRSNGSFPRSILIPISTMQCGIELWIATAKALWTQKPKRRLKGLLPQCWRRWHLALSPCYRTEP